MKKKLYNLITLISIFCLVVCICCQLFHKEFDASNVKKNIDYLSSEELKGRLAGTYENTLVAEKIESKFKNLKLKPLTDDYKDKFSTVIPEYTGGKSSLQLINKDKSVTKFTLGEDFKEDFLNFKKSSVQFSKNDNIEIFSNGFSITKDGIEYLFYVNLDKNFSFRSSFYEDSKYGFVIQISTDTFSKILDSLRNGSVLKVDLPYKSSEKEICNVVGKIDGFDKKLPPLVLTAHFDHVGTDSLGKYYPGALDNASGVSFLLELAKRYSSLLVPKRDIIFVALNAEELGLRGSEAFASKYKDTLKDAEVINFDMVGIDDFPLTLMSGKDCSDKDSEVLDEIEKICKEKDKNYEESFADSSDHASFINNGFDALTVSHSDISNIHTPNDTPDKISASALNDVYNIINLEVTSSSYYDIFLIFYNKKLLIFFSLFSTLLTINLLLTRKKLQNQKSFLS